MSHHYKTIKITKRLRSEWDCNLKKFIHWYFWSLWLMKIVALVIKLTSYNSYQVLTIQWYNCTMQLQRFDYTFAKPHKFTSYTYMVPLSTEKALKMTLYHFMSKGLLTNSTHRLPQALHLKLKFQLLKNSHLILCLPIFLDINETCYSSSSAFSCNRTLISIWYLTQPLWLDIVLVRDSSEALLT